MPEKKKAEAEEPVKESAEAQNEALAESAKRATEEPDSEDVTYIVNGEEVDPEGNPVKKKK